MDEQQHGGLPPGTTLNNVVLTPDGPVFAEHGAGLLACGSAKCTKPPLDHWIEFAGQVAANGYPITILPTPTGGYRAFSVMPVYDIGAVVLCAIATAAAHPEWAAQTASAVQELTRRYPAEEGVDHTSTLTTFMEQMHSWLPVPAIDAEAFPPTT